MLNVNYKNVLSFITEEEIKENASVVLKAKKTLLEKTGKGNDFLGWIEYPNQYDQVEFEKIKQAAKKIRQDSEVLVVIGIGGSYLGAKAVIEALQPYFSKEKGLEIIFAGNSLSATYHKELLDYLEDKDFSINVISKSGTTTEPAVAFRLYKALLTKKYQSRAAERIYATTDKEKGALRNLAIEEGYTTFVVPDDIGGRYSWFTAVGLLPIASAGIDIDALMQGAKVAYQDAVTKSYLENPALLYASIRNLLYQKGKMTEVLVTFEPKVSFISEWWKQLYGESEGKDHQGIFPASLVYSTDLHSMGQYIQDGKRMMFETVINIDKPSSDILLQKEPTDLDGLNYLEGRNLDSVAKKAMQGTILAHVDGEVPNLVLNIEQLDAYHLGYLLYFFMFACGVSGYILGVNPFNQPGVEDYKKNMFALLGKPGYEELLKKLKERL
ncbi:MAG: glucose-6-phosphate isomerase [Anaeroplasma bactoclasticum]|nr:glucose-6-phosphate isomerase [Anaeroplasma bactoclasticum]